MSLHKRVHEFAVGDKVMLGVRPERLRFGTWKKFPSRCIDPCRVLQRISFNAYWIVIPQELGINPVLNIEELTPYRSVSDYPTIIPDLSSFR